MADRPTLEVLADVVRRMRTAQREYFRTRDHAALRTSKSLEKRVDELLEALAGDATPKPQGSLFR